MYAAPNGYSSADFDGHHGINDVAKNNPEAANTGLDLKVISRRSLARKAPRLEKYIILQRSQKQ
jgi:hypothetical protein